MPRSDCTTMTSRRSRARTIVLIVLILLTALDAASGVPYRRSLVRLCSKNLSDALYLACKDRGYNEPFSYSGEDDSQDSVGPGLAEECCYHACTYAQLEQYCKPDKDNGSSADAVKESIWILNFPFRSGRSGTSEERSRSGIGFVSGTIKCKIIRQGLKGARKQRINDVDGGGCNGKNVAGSAKKNRGRHNRCHRRRQRRCRPDKESAKILIAEAAQTKSRNAQLLSTDTILSRP